MKIAYYDIKPIIYEAIGNGSYLYRWNIEKYQEETHEGSCVVTKWKCHEVIIWATVTADKITESVINAIWSNDVEAKKLNDYNAAQLGVLDNSYIDAYRVFLIERKAIKEHIDADCVELGIPK